MHPMHVFAEATIKDYYKIYAFCRKI